MNIESIIQQIAIYAIPVLLAITVHEAAHGYIAKYFGDSTAYVLGRMTLNPAKHIDPIGTIAVPLGILFTSSLAGAPMMFGWAKPVPVDWSRLRHPKRDMIWVAAAGPAANLVMAILWALLLRVLVAADVEERYFYAVANAGISVNLVLMALNLLPIPPLDGGRILVGLLPRNLSNQVARIEPYGMIILIVLLVSQTLAPLIYPFQAAGAYIVRLFV